MVSGERTLTEAWVFRSCLIAIASLMVHAQMAHAQGLKGVPSCIRHLTQNPPLLQGATDEQRWNTFVKSQRLLIGMNRIDLVRLFGSGAASATGKEITFKLTDEKLPSTKGHVAYLELTIKFADEKVSGYCVEAVYWG